MWPNTKYMTKYHRITYTLTLIRIRWLSNSLIWSGQLSLLMRGRYHAQHATLPIRMRKSFFFAVVFRVNFTILLNWQWQKWFFSRRSSVLIKNEHYPVEYIILGVCSLEKMLSNYFGHGGAFIFWMMWKRGPSSSTT